MYTNFIRFLEFFGLQVQGSIEIGDQFLLNKIIL